jgi:hypothetical protein
MATISARLAIWAVVVTTVACEEDHHDGHGEVEVCACAAGEEQHPFTLDCTNADQITAAAATLNSADCAATEVSCGALTDGVMLCQTAFFQIQAHHDYCDHDAAIHALLETHSGLVHTFEDACMSCSINKAYEADLPACVVPTDCEDPAPANAGRLFALDTSTV